MTFTKKKSHTFSISHKSNQNYSFQLRCALQIFAQKCILLITKGQSCITGLPPCQSNPLNEFSHIGKLEMGCLPRLGGEIASTHCDVTSQIMESIEVPGDFPIGWSNVRLLDFEGCLWALHCGWAVLPTV